MKLHRVPAAHTHWNPPHAIQDTEFALPAGQAF